MKVDIKKSADFFHNSFNHDIGKEYNRQIDNISFDGVFNPRRQCGPTTAFMFLGRESSKVDGANDKQLAWFISMIEYSVSGEKAKYAVEVMGKFPSIKKWTSQYWETMQHGMNQVLEAQKVPGRFEKKLQMNWLEFLEKLENGPVMTDGYKIDGLPSGHFFLVTGFEKVDIPEGGFFVCADPWFGKNIKRLPSELKTAMVDYQKRIFNPYGKEDHISGMWFENE